MKNITVILLGLLFVISTFAKVSQDKFRESWELLYPFDDFTFVMNINYSTFQIPEYGLLFSLYGESGGLGFFNNDSMETFNVTGFSGAIDISADESNNRILAIFGNGSNSDGIYSFDMESKTFEINQYFENPLFIKKMNSGFYVGSFQSGGLLVSYDGDEWYEVEFFNDKNVMDIEETDDGQIFIATDEGIFLQVGATFRFLEISPVITDIYITEIEQRVFISVGNGGALDCVYEVEFDSSNIIGLVLIAASYLPNKLYEYIDLLVIGSNSSNGLYLVEQISNGEQYHIGNGFGIEMLYSFQTYPIYTNNFLICTDIGVYLGTNFLTGIDDDYTSTQLYEYRLNQNYPNPFNPTTKINYELRNTDYEFAEIVVYNSVGKKVWSSKITNNNLQVTGSILFNGSKFNSGIYYYSLVVDGIQIETKSMVLIK